VVFEVVNKEHIPNNTPIVAGTTQVVKRTPNRPITYVRSHLPKEKNSYHIGRPYPYDTMHDAPNIKLEKTFHLLELLKHTQSD
jgi:hypothetical protein